MTSRLAPALVLLLAASACAPAQNAEAPEVGLAADAGDVPQEEKPTPPPPSDVVEKAAREFTGYRTADGKTFSAESLMTHLASADAICIGERHNQVLDHYAQLATIQAFIERRSMRGFELGVALEMVRAESQVALTKFADDRLDGPTLAQDTDWKNEWGYPIEYYLPQMKAAQTAGADLLALGVRRDVTQKIAEGGIKSVPKEIAHLLPELDLGVKQHRAMFDLMMAGHPHRSPEKPKGESRDHEHGADEDHEHDSNESKSSRAPGDSHATIETYYEAQVVWDEAMAQRSAAWLKQRSPGRKLIILAGAGHCHNSAIPARIERRGDFKAISILPVEAGTDPAEDSTDPGDKLVSQMRREYDYIIQF